MTEETYGWVSRQSIITDSNIDKIPEYDPRSREHYWILLVSYRVDPLKWTKDSMPILDQENRVSISGPGCYYCEQPFSERLAHRACPGEPK